MGLGPRVRGQALGFGVLGLGFGVSGSGFGVWGLGVGVEGSRGPSLYNGFFLDFATNAWILLRATNTAKVFRPLCTSRPQP